LPDRNELEREGKVIDMMEIDGDMVSRANIDLDVKEDEIVDYLPMDVITKAPSIYSWGRSDTDALLRSPNDLSAADGIHTLTFANQRTIVQVGSNSY
jgi:hypothetical protein